MGNALRSRIQRIRVKLQQGDLVLVTWLDAFTHPGGYWQTDDVCDLKPMTTVGYFVTVSDEYLTVAQSMSHCSDDETQQFGGVFSVPIQFLVSTRKIKERK
jgi:hypothetical protein